VPDAVTLVGGAEAAADLGRWAAQVGPIVERESPSFAADVADRVQGEVPVLTGTLASSVEVIEVHDGAGIAMGDGVPYAGWIEFGGSRGRPFIAEGRYLYPTALEAEAEFGELAAEAADDSVRRFAWSTPPQ
jgi:hypothetical protein